MLLKLFAFNFTLFLTLNSLAVSRPQRAGIAFKHAEQLEKSSRYEEALLEYQDIEKEFPYSKYAKLSKLKVADVHFDMASYVQAQYQYQYYYDLYPKEDNSDYALYRVGLSMFKTLPKTIDRDLRGSTDVLKAWRKLLVKFPNSKYTDDILKNQKKILTNLGEKELYIANFYIKQDKFISAQRRLNKLFKQFPSFLKNKKALKAALTCAKKLNDEPLEKKYTNLLKKAV